MQNKILLTVTIMCITSFTAVAQIKKGALFLGGQFGVSSSSGKGEGSANNFQLDDKGFFIAMAIGKALKENFIIGGDITYGNSTFNSNYSNYSHDRTYGVGFFARKYKQLGKGFYLFGQVRAGANWFDWYSYSTAQTFFYDTHGFGSNVRLGLYPGVAFNTSKRIQLEAGFNNIGYIQYTMSRETSRTGSYGVYSSSYFSAGSSFSSLTGFSLGFRVLLN